MPLVHRFSYEISTVDPGKTGEIEHFMSLTHPGINKNWVRVAIKNGENCYVARLSNEIAGLGWVSMVTVGRLHSLYVKPQFRRIGIGEDILNATTFLAQIEGCLFGISEISRYNVSSSSNAPKAHMKLRGQVFQYFKKGLNGK